MKYVILCLLLLTTNLSFSQNRRLTDEEMNASGVKELIFAPDDQSCSTAILLAEKDIRNNLPFLLLKSGLNPIFYSKDKEFQTKFNIYYYDEGCTGPSYSCMVSYNRRVFQYLMSIYGNRWMKNVRKDVIGFKDWKKYIKN